MRQDERIGCVSFLAYSSLGFRKALLGDPSANLICVLGCLRFGFGGVMDLPGRVRELAVYAQRRGKIDSAVDPQSTLRTCGSGRGARKGDRPCQNSGGVGV